MRVQSILRVVSLGVMIAAQSSAFAQDAGADQMDGEVKDLEWVGFQQFSDGSRVFVRTTEPVTYTVDTSRPDMVVLVLENTSISLANNTNHLDTRWFAGPVLNVRAKYIEGTSPSVHIEILLRQPTAYSEFKRETTLGLDFARQ
jgi:colicin import membrane protein